MSLTNTEARATSVCFLAFRILYLSPTHLAHSFVNSRPFVTSNIIGATTMEQLKENIESVNINLTQEILEKINLIHNNHPNPSP